MTKSQRLVPLTLAVLLAAGGAVGFAQAKEPADSNARNVAALAGLTMPLTQAITAAEQQSGGRAVDADRVQHGGATQVAVELVDAKGTHTVLVDGKTGQVTAAPAEKADAADND